MKEKSNSQYESFLFWRQPIPALNLSELEDLGLTDGQSTNGRKGKDKPSKLRRQDEEVREDDCTLSVWSPDFMCVLRISLIHVLVVFKTSSSSLQNHFVLLPAGGAVTHLSPGCSLTPSSLHRRSWRSFPPLTTGDLQSLRWTLCSPTSTCCCESGLNWPLTPWLPVPWSPDLWPQTTCPQTTSHRPHLICDPGSWISLLLQLEVFI